MPARPLHTYLTRGAAQTVLGQFRHAPAAPHAQLTYLAPRAFTCTDDSACLQLLDALTAAAGQRGAHTLNAEVDECSPLFETMRQAGFAIYARQELWRCPPGTTALRDAKTLAWQRARSSDIHDMRQLLRALVPPMLHHALEQPAERAGWLYREDGRALAILAIQRGRRAYSLLPYLHPRLAKRVAALLRGALALTSTKLPRYITLRRYQDWWSGALPALGFTCHARQAVLVRHIAAGVRATRFQDELLEALEKGITPVLEYRAPPPAIRRLA